MAEPVAPEAKFHALLIGIDNYPRRELKGCVNDIDAVQRVLERLPIPREQIQIRRLASPLPSATREPVPGEQDATALNIRQELRALGSDSVTAGDRVFIYYSGHGKRIAVKADDRSMSSREALVPVDFERARAEEAFLFDFEFDRLLGAIAARTRSVTVVLDCCHADGTRRADDEPPPDSQVRALEEDHEPVPDPARDADRSRGDTAHARDPGADACQIVSACLAHEFARENGQGGIRHGMLTRAFLNALAPVPDPDLPSITWAQIWRTMRAEVMGQNRAQTPRIDGYLGRAVFAGPPVHGDPGIPVVQSGDRYQIWAGEIAEITEGVELAVYGDLPLRFPPLGSAEDRAARVGVVRVTEATLSDAVAIPIEAPFTLPPGARGRVVKADRLPCAVIPPDPEILTALGASSLITPAGAGEEAKVRVELHDGRWYVMDEQHGTGREAPVLVALPPGDADRVRAVLEHYHRYALPLRIARRAAAAQPRALELRLLSCPTPDFDPAQADVSKLSEVPRGPDERYLVQNGAAVCVCVRNTTSDRLHVALLDVTGAGDVQQLDDQIIEPKALHVFWRLGNEPYRLWLDRGIRWSRDRLVAIGRSSRYPLDHLSVSETFADVVARGHVEDPGDAADRRMGGSTGGGPTELWAAAESVIEIREP